MSVVDMSHEGDAKVTHEPDDDRYESLPMHRSLFVAALLTTMGCASAQDSTSSADLDLVSPDVAAKVTVTVEPSDKGAALVDAINAATKSIHVTMYILTAPTVLDALVAQHKAGLDVKVILNKNSAFATPPDAGATADGTDDADEADVPPDADDFDPDTSNTTTFATLQAAGIPVVWSSSAYRYTHEKCIILDGTTAWIMTMNSATASLTKNREYLGADSLAADVKEAEQIFEADFAAKPITPAGNLLVSPVSMRDGLVTLIGKAKKTIDFEVEELGDATVTNAFCAAATGGATVRGLLADITESATEKKAVTALKACGVTLFTLKKPYIHAKAIVVDGDEMYVGSANFSAVSLSQNRELGFVSTTASTIAPVATTVAADIAAGTAL